MSSIVSSSATPASPVGTSKQNERALRLPRGSCCISRSIQSELCPEGSTDRNERPLERELLVRGDVGEEVAVVEPREERDVAREYAGRLWRPGIRVGVRPGSRTSPAWIALARW